MHTEGVVLFIGTALFAVGLLAEITFFTLYVRQGNAHRSSIGWMFLFMSTSVFSVGIAILLGRIFGPDYPGRSVVTICVYAIWAISMVWKLVTYLRERRKPLDMPLRTAAARTFRMRRPRRAARKVTGNTGPVPIFKGGPE